LIDFQNRTKASDKSNKLKSVANSSQQISWASNYSEAHGQGNMVERTLTYLAKRGWQTEVEQISNGVR